MGNDLSKTLETGYESAKSQARHLAIAGGLMISASGTLGCDSIVTFARDSAIDVVNTDQTFPVSCADILGTDPLGNPLTPYNPNIYCPNGDLNQVVQIPTAAYLLLETTRKSIFAYLDCVYSPIGDNFTNIAPDGDFHNILVGGISRSSNDCTGCSIGGETSIDPNSRTPIYVTEKLSDGQEKPAFRIAKVIIHERGHRGGLGHDDSQPNFMDTISNPPADMRWTDASAALLTNNRWGEGTPEAITAKSQFLDESRCERQLAEVEAIPKSP